MSQIICLEAEEIIAKCQEMFIAMFDEDYPYIIPVNFVYLHNSLYFHTGNIGKKVDLIVKNPNLAFSMCTDVEVRPELASTFFKSIVGKAKAKIIEEPEEKILVLAEISKRYNSNCQTPAPPNKLAKTKIIKLEILDIDFRKKEKIAK